MRGKKAKLSKLTFEGPHTSRPISFFSSSGPDTPSRVLRLSNSFLNISSSAVSVNVMISSRTGRELCIVDPMGDVVVEVGFVGSGGGKAERIGYRCDSGRRRYRACMSYVID